MLSVIVGGAEHLRGPDLFTVTNNKEGGVGMKKIGPKLNYRVSYCEANPGGCDSTILKSHQHRGLVSFAFSFVVHSVVVLVEVEEQELAL